MGVEGKYRYSSQLRYAAMYCTAAAASEQSLSILIFYNSTEQYLLNFRNLHRSSVCSIAMWKWFVIAKHQLCQFFKAMYLPKTYASLVSALNSTAQG